MRIIIIEDEKDLAMPLKKSLETAGFAVDYTEDGQKGLELTQSNDYDCILLDLNLPEIDGLSLARQLRATKNTTPIIMLTARSQLYNKIEGFDHGADDYITKPFALKELLARIRAVIKRNSMNKQEILTFGEYELIPSQNKVLSHKANSPHTEISLSNKETGILEYLLRNKGTIVSTEKILEHVWDREIDTFTDTVKTHIKTLRKKIDPEKNILKTIRRKGYVIE